MPSPVDTEPQLVSDAVPSRISPALLGVVTTLILSGVVLAAFPPRYETNDDAAMNLIAAGVVHATEPDEHLVYTNITLGYPLSRLYRFTPSVPWYGLYQLFAVTTSAAAIGGLLLKISRSWKQWILLCLHFFAAIAPCLINIQFTKSAFLATEAGLLLLIGPWLRDEFWPRGWTIAGIALALLGAAIRFDAFLLALVAIAPIVAWAAWKRSSRPWKPVLAPLLIALSCAMLLQFAHRNYYETSPEWREFLEFNGYRHRIVTGNESLRYDERTKPVFDAVGWSPADYVMLKTWFCSDPKLYSTSRLRQFAREISKFESSVNGPREIAARVQPSAGTIWLWVVIAASLLSLSGRTARLALVVSFAYSSLLALAVSAWFQHLPDRVLFSLFLPPAVFGALAARDGFAPLNIGFEGLLQRVGGFAALIAVAGAANSWSEHWKSRLEFEDYASNVLRQLDPRPDLLFVTWGAAFPLEFLVRPLGSLDTMRPVRCLSIGWELRSPIADRRMQEFGIDDLPRALSSRNDVLLVCHRTLLPILDQYLEEHEGVFILVRTIHHDDYGFGDVVQIRRGKRRSSP